MSRAPKPKPPPQRYDLVMRRYSHEYCHVQVTARTEAEAKREAVALADSKGCWRRDPDHRREPYVEDDEDDIMELEQPPSKLSPRRFYRTVVEVLSEWPLSETELRLIAIEAREDNQTNYNLPYGKVLAEQEINSDTLSRLLRWGDHHCEFEDFLLTEDGKDLPEHKNPQRRRSAALR